MTLEAGVPMPLAIFSNGSPINHTRLASWSRFVLVTALIDVSQGLVVDENSYFA